MIHMYLQVFNHMKAEAVTFFMTYPKASYLNKYPWSLFHMLFCVLAFESLAWWLILIVHLRRPGDT